MTYINLENTSARITASYETLCDDAVIVPAKYLRHAQQQIDEQFGKGYAEQHPELLCALIQTMQREFQTSTWQKVVQEEREIILDVLKDLIKRR